MNDRAAIEAMRDNPEGRGLNNTYYATAMFLTGMDVGMSGGLLRGFTQWLVVRRGECSSFYWHKLVLLDLFPDMNVGGWKNPDHLTPEQHEQVVQHLFSLVLQFLDVRNDPWELGRMYARHRTMYAHILE
ncbi:hypothetical protein [Streptomyces sp. IBSBF 2806]|uniref:hypothetical protein n=1 Tax=Streptomyces sp. IBSBF 2806 TaxID=2903529 RepID=UPI002FDC1546